MWLPRWLTTWNPARPRARRTSRAARMGSRDTLHLDRGQEEGLLGEVGLLALEAKLQGLAEVRQGLLHRAPLPRHLQLGAPRHEPAPLAIDPPPQPPLHL